MTDRKSFIVNKKKKKKKEGGKTPPSLSKSNSSSEEVDERLYKILKPLILKFKKIKEEKKC